MSTLEKMKIVMTREHYDALKANIDAESAYVGALLSDSATAAGKAFVGLHQTELDAWRSQGAYDTIPKDDKK